MSFTHKENPKPAFLYGIRPLMEAISSGKEVEKVFFQKNLKSELITELFRQVREHNIPFQYVPVEKLNRLTSKNHQGVAAFLSPVIFQRVENILPSLFEQGKTPLLLILDRVTDVRNFGAICRSAESAGAHAVIVPDRGAAQVNEDAVKTSAGALNRIPLCRSANLKDTLVYLKDSGLKLVACTEKTSSLLYTSDLNGPLALVLGSEEDGISPEYLKLCDEKVKIPLMGAIASLNVSVAAGIILYEAVRQRKEF